MGAEAPAAHERDRGRAGAAAAVMIIRRATIADAAVLAEFGRRTFIETFAAQNTPEDMEAFCAKAYGVAQQTREIEQGITLLGEEHGALIAFAQLHASD